MRYAISATSSHALHVYAYIQTYYYYIIFIIKRLEYAARN